MTAATLGAHDPGDARRRYSALAILLHWILALAFAGQVLLGWYEQDGVPDHSPAQDAILAIHVSVGLTVLLLTVARLALRLSRGPPDLPAAMAGWEKGLAHVTHVIFYLLMLGLPLSGWTLASMGRRPIRFWGLFDWPRLPVAGLIPQGQGRALHHTVETFHGSVLVWIGIALVALHIAGALKHQFDRTPVLWRMVPFLRPPAT